MSGKRTSAVEFLIIFSFLFLLLNCAELAPPPGGEEDRTSPTLIRTLPENKSIHVTSGREITFWFSEGISKPSISKPVFISPRQEQNPELKWKSDRLIVKLAEPFDSNQTYVVTLTSEISDWRRNKMDSTVSIAFSTGDRIDSGSISGFVLAYGKPKSGVLVGLFEQSSPAEEIQYDSLYPEYLTQSAADGSFKFRYLPAGNFRLVAFEDLDRNERFNPAEEPFAVPDRSTDFSPAYPLSELYLEMSPPVTKIPQISSALVTPDGLIRIRLNTNIDLAYLKNSLGEISLRSTSVPERTQNARAFLESHLDTSSVLTVCAGPVDSGQFTVTVKADSLAEPMSFTNLVVGKVKDKNPPSISGFTPENRAHFIDKIDAGIVFSEPIDTTKVTAGTFVLMDDSEQQVILQLHWFDPFHLAFLVGELAEGRRYSFKIAEFEIADLAGNLLGDSIATFEFSVLDTDSLGSVSGNVRVELPGKGKNVSLITFAHISGQPSFVFLFEGDSFTVELPAGKYLMSGYLDENNNGKRDLGMIRPFSFAETFNRSVDTVSVRARFETAGIEFQFK